MLASDTYVKKIQHKTAQGCCAILRGGERQNDWKLCDKLRFWRGEIRHSAVES